MHVVVGKGKDLRFLPTKLTKNTSSHTWVKKGYQKKFGKRKNEKPKRFFVTKRLKKDLCCFCRLLRV